MILDLGELDWNRWIKECGEYWSYFLAGSMGMLSRKYYC